MNTNVIQFRTPMYFAEKIKGRPRESVVNEMAMHLVAAGVDLDHERACINRLYLAEQQYGGLVILDHLADAIFTAREIHTNREMSRREAGNA